MALDLPEKVLYKTHFRDAIYDCGNEADPGVNEAPEWRDWTGRPTTAGETRIIDFLAHSDLAGKVLVHVGVGNSSLARRLSKDLRTCVGTTIDVGEARHAKALGLQNYSVRSVNKYSVAFTSAAFKADWIVDSNPTTFACCFRHFYRMMVAYRDQLRAGGCLVTEAKGLRFVSSANPEPEPWRLSPSDWSAIMTALGFVTRSPDGAVLVSTKKDF